MPMMRCSFHRARPDARGKAAILAFFTERTSRTRKHKARNLCSHASQAIEVRHRASLRPRSPSRDNIGWEVGYIKVLVKGAVVDTGKWLSVMRKKDGKWQLIRDTWNMDTPPAPPEAKK